jgi:3',5'-cyclic AMP phosphodiesterase CpdA
MNRRNFLSSSLVASGAFISLPGLAWTGAKNKEPVKFVRQVTPFETVFFIKGLIKEVSIMQISDSHISTDGPADVQYESHSKRLREAYKKRKHYKTGELVAPAAVLDEILAKAVEEKIDLLSLSGDIINYPSQTAVAFISKKVEATGIPYIYTAGNHDWHYEGMEGSSEYLRNYWIEERLKPLYKGTNPYFSVYETPDVKVVTIDNSIYQISDEQLTFFRRQDKSGKPILLFVHIPLYMPGMPVVSTGHPDWSAAADKLYKTERRQPWAAGGNTKTTLNFLKAVMKSRNVLGVFAGHWHGDVVYNHGNTAQYICPPGYSGHYRIIRLKNLA